MDRTIARTSSPTIRDVAHRAGVSVTTVSRTLNASGPVSEEVQRRVRAAAAELRYLPDVAARTLITRRTEVFGVVLPDLFGEFFSEVIRGMGPSARQRGYHLLLSSSHDGLGEIAFAAGAMRGRVDGMIVMSPDASAAELKAALPADVPVVLLSCDVAGSDVSSVNLDNLGGARSVVRHLAALGHRRIGLITGGPGNFDSDERRRGFHEEAAAAGVEGVEATGDFTEGSGYQAALALMSLPDAPTALFCANDAMAVGAIRAMHDTARRVPEDVAVVGFDDIPIGRYLTPSLTSVRVDFSRLGSRAVELLCHAIDGDEPPTQERLPTELLIRRSCGGADSNT